MPEDDKGRNEATETAELYHRHGEADSSGWDEQTAVTGRPNDTPLRGEDTPAVPNTTFADRAKAQRSEAKTIDSADAENKAVASADTKTTRRRAK